MTVNFTPKTIFCLIVFLWVIFSVVYVVNDIWSNYKYVQLVQAYEQGRQDTINTLIEEAEKCQAIPVFSGEKEITLMSLSCLGTGE